MTTTPDRPRCCERLGLDFGDGPVCTRHQTDEQRRLARALERRAARLGLEPLQMRVGSPIEWPYGLGRPGAVVADRVALLDWMQTNRLRPAKIRGRRLDTGFAQPNLHWLRSENCPVGRYEKYQFGEQCPECYGPRHWMDHASGWVRADGVRVFVSQPYGLLDQDYADLARLDAEPDLRVQIDTGGWYGAGYIVSVFAGEESTAARIAVGKAEFGRALAERWNPARVNAEVRS